MSRSTLALLLAIALAGCGGETPVSPGPAAAALDPGTSSSQNGAGTEIELRYDQALVFQDLELQWLKLEDSRCPIGVTCIWAGQIVVDVEVIRGEEDPVEVELLVVVGDDPVAARAFGYELRLLGVEPHPKDGVEPKREDFVARIEIVEP